MVALGQDQLSDTTTDREDLDMIFICLRPRTLRVISREQSFGVSGHVRRGTPRWQWMVRMAHNTPSASSAARFEAAVH